MLCIFSASLIHSFQSRDPRADLEGQRWWLTPDFLRQGNSRKKFPVAQLFRSPVDLRKGMVRYGHKLQVLDTCKPYTAYCGISAFKNCQSSTLVTFTCTLWRTPHLILLPLFGGLRAGSSSL